jgi:hypothetical protein
VTWPYDNDGLWHVVVVDARSAWGQAAGETLYAFRFDPLASGASAGDTIDVAYISFFSTQEEADACAEEENLKLGYSSSNTPSTTPSANPTTYQAAFLVQGRTVYTVTFQAGDTALEEPVVPHIPGYTGVWEAYTLQDQDLTIQAVYTPLDSSTEQPLSQGTETLEPDTDPEDETESSPAQSSTSEGTNTEAETISSTASGGCASSALSAVAVMLLPAGLIPVLGLRHRSRHADRTDGT